MIFPEGLTLSIGPVDGGLAHTYPWAGTIKIIVPTCTIPVVLSGTRHVSSTTGDGGHVRLPAGKSLPPGGRPDRPSRSPGLQLDPFDDVVAPVGHVDGDDTDVFFQSRAPELGLQEFVDLVDARCVVHLDLDEDRGPVPR